MLILTVGSHEGISLQKSDKSKDRG